MAPDFEGKVIQQGDIQNERQWPKNIMIFTIRQANTLLGKGHLRKCGWKLIQFRWDVTMGLVGR